MARKKQVFAVACANMLLFGIGLITLGSVVPDLKIRFELDDIAAGTLFSILPLGILLGSLFFGPICDRSGYKVLLTISSLLMCIGFVGIGYASSMSLLKICIFFFGIGGGAINGATNAVVADISEKNKGANLSLLGISFGVGALGMPALIALLRHQYNFSTILSVTAVYAALVALIVLSTRFPEPKQKQGFPLKQAFLLIKDRVLILIAFFLFLQSSLEAIINNWTALFLVNQLSIETSAALFSLSLFVAGLTVMRILLGSVFRNVSVHKLMYASFLLSFAGLILLKWADNVTMANAGLILVGGGLSAGFPIMLGAVGARYSSLSATAFSFVLVIALLGNMLINYTAGIVAQRSGIHHIISIALLEVMIMAILYFAIQRTNKTSHKIQN